MPDRRQPRRPDHGTVIAYLALFVALSGTAWAAATIGPADIQDDAVRSHHILDGQVRSADVANDGGANALTGTDVANESLTGTDVQNGSLTGNDIANDTITGANVKDNDIASADIFGNLTGGDIADGSLSGADVNDSSLTGADVQNDSLTGPDIWEATLEVDARSTDGTSLDSANFNATTGLGTTPHLLTADGLDLTAACVSSGGDRVKIWANTDTDNSYVRGPSAADADFDQADTALVLDSTGDGAGVIGYRQGSSQSVTGKVVTVQLVWDTNPTGNDCQLVGTMIATG
jgi:uncharacterized protein YjbI with pentapeptide repeats